MVRHLRSPEIVEYHESFESTKDLRSATNRLYLPKLHILIADDEPDNQLMLQLMLEKMGATVSLAETGKAAVEQFLANSFDIILMDIQMPNMNGCVATQLIRESENKRNLKRTPILVQTALSLRDIYHQCIESGCDDILIKPIYPQQLHSKIVESLKCSKEKPMMASEKPKPTHIAETDFLVILDSSYRDVMPGIIERKYKQMDALHGFIEQKNVKETISLTHQYMGLRGLKEVNLLAQRINTSAQQGKWKLADDLAHEMDHFLKNIKLQYIDGWEY